MKTAFIIVLLFSVALGAFAVGAVETEKSSVVLTEAMSFVGISVFQQISADAIDTLQGMDSILTSSVRFDLLAPDNRRSKNFVVSAV